MTPTLESLRSWVAYCPETGGFVWLRKPAFGVAVGDVAGHTRKDGYVTINVQKTCFKAHRLAWLFIHGQWPAGELDHINGIRDDNRIANLREVTHSENAQNKRNARADNSTGVLGVTRDGKRYRAQIRVNGAATHLGCYATIEEAASVYADAKRRLHPITAQTAPAPAPAARSAD